MQPTLIIGNAIIYQGNNLDILPELQSNSVDSIVCDPPYELGFMGKTWDSSGIAYSVQLWRECLRVLKPGGHLLAFGGTRTWHRLAVAIEDAGFEIRDNIAWLYGSGFPKSHNISKAIDKTLGGEVKVGKAFKVAGEYGNRDLRDPETQGASREEMKHTADTDDAKKWDGWGTALKPAHEPIVVARKPFIGTVAENVLKHGVGAINIDATRIGTTDKFGGGAKGSSGFAANYDAEGWTEGSSLGRWPANIILDEYTAELLDEQSGNQVRGNAGSKQTTNFTFGSTQEKQTLIQGTTDKGGASRFFYVAKASKRDRNEGLDELPDQILTGRDEGQDERQVPYKTRSNPVKNTHPTVKPTALMQYLIRLVTPDNGVVLDPFAGSGSTGKAAILEGFGFIGIELTEEYLPIIAGRLEHAANTSEEKGDDLFASL